MSKTIEKAAEPSIDMELLAKKKVEDTTFADLVSYISPNLSLNRLNLIKI